MKKCEIINCGATVAEQESVNVYEAIWDSCFNVVICKECASKLGIKEGDFIPENAAKILHIM